MSELYRNNKRSAVGQPFLFFVSFFLVFIFAQAGFAEQSDNVALLIGNAEYPDAIASGAPPLKDPVNDARALHDELVGRGFDVEFKKNLTREEMQRALDHFYGNIKSGATALIFFSGFAIQSQRQNYLLPVDAQIWTEANIRQEGFSVERIIDEMNSRGAKVKIAIIDGARKNLYETDRLRRPSAGLAPVSPRGSLLILSADPGALVTDAGSSAFMRELLKELQVSGVLEDAFNRTKTDVRTATRSQQVPAVYSNLQEEYTLPKRTTPITKPLEPPQAKTEPPQEKVKPEPSQEKAKSEPSQDKAKPEPFKPTAAESDDYSYASRKGTREALQDFLNKYPSGTYAEAARKELESLKPKPAPEPRPSPPAQEPKVGEAYQRGLAHAHHGEYDLALKEFDEAIRRDPENAAALNDRCWVRAVVGRLNEAMNDCNEALRLGNNYALDTRGFVNLKLGLFNQAVSDYSAALVLDSNRASSLYGRGWANLRRGNLESGQNDIRAAKGIEPTIADEFAGYGIK